MGVDLFASYAGPDQAWAEWAAGQLLRAGYSIELDVWDWAVGDSAILNMTDALAKADRLLMVWSKAYFERTRFTTDEWTAVLARRPDAQGRRLLVPVWLEAVEPPDVLRPLVSRRVLGDDHPDTLNSARNPAGGLRRLGRDDEARPIEDEFGFGTE